MAYRFLLEVPESRVDECNIEVGAAGDAQVILVRNSHGQGFDTATTDLTIAAHSLRVIHFLYDWFEGLAAPKPQVAIVLHSGGRLSLAEHTRGEMIGAIRRDQPWVERTIPKIGDHARDILPDSTYTPKSVRSNAEPTPINEPILRARKHLTFLTGVQVEIKVTELERAERYYVDFLGVHLLGRERINDDGEYEIVERDYDGIAALSLGTEADVSFLSNGPLKIALRRVGRGARLERNADGPIKVTVDRDTFLKLKGDAFMRGMEIALDVPGALAVRDIYGLVWEFNQTADIPVLA